MSFTTPLWLVAAGAVAAGLVLAHLISTSVPQRDPFPTARFVPEGAPLTVLRTRRLTDLPLLLLRLLAVALLGIALAGAHLPRQAPSRVVLADVSRAVGSLREVRDSVSALGDVPILLVFDSSARLASLDSLSRIAERREPGIGSGAAASRRPGVGGAPASLSSAIISLYRTLSDFTEDREKTELVIVSPLVSGETDSATAAILALWEGPIRHVRVQSAAGNDGPVRIESRTDDPVAASLRPAPAAAGSGLGTRMIRGAASAKDSSWAREGGAIVIWPSDLETSGFPRRASPDTMQGIAAGADVVIGSFARTHQPRDGRMLVAWIDGSAAATERVLGAGCVREVAIPVDPVGDIALRESFRGIARRLTEPCGGAMDLAAVELASLRQPGADSREPGVARREPSAGSPLGIWFAALALAALVAEQIVRRRRTTA